MLRNIDLSEESDGRLYATDDMVKAGCMGCVGCSSCCRGMGKSIVLDPYDVYMLTTGLNTDFYALSADKIELSVVDGLVLPNLKLSGEDERCSFLDGAGRCSIHSIRPCICRMFPLGRIFENGSHRYFLQINECPYPQKTKVKVKKQLGYDNITAYEKYTDDWHNFINEIRGIINNCNDEVSGKICTLILNRFFIEPYAPEDFYGQFYNRLELIRNYM